MNPVETILNCPKVTLQVREEWEAQCPVFNGDLGASVDRAIMLLTNSPNLREALSCPKRRIPAGEVRPDFDSYLNSLKRFICDYFDPEEWNSFADIVRRFARAIAEHRENVIDEERSFAAATALLTADSQDAAASVMAQINAGGFDDSEMVLRRATALQKRTFARQLRDLSKENAAARGNVELNQTALKLYRAENYDSLYIDTAIREIREGKAKMAVLKQRRRDLVAELEAAGFSEQEVLDF